MRPAIAPSNVPILLLTTADMTAGRDADLQWLVTSVERFMVRNPQTPLHHVMLLQRCESAAAACAQLGFPERMDVFAVGELVPLSIARNLMINRALASPPFPLEAALVAFPDDDAWYPDGTLDHIHQCFASDRDLDLWFCRYGSEAQFPAGLREKTPTLHEVISKASSNTVAIRGRVLDTVVGFDEHLGLGTPAKSGEDTDFAIRSFLAARKARYAPYRMVGHRDFDPAIRAKYYGGTLVALGRHKGKSVAAAASFIRKILVGLALVARRELRPGEFAGAVRMYADNSPAINVQGRLLAAVAAQATG